VLLAQTFDPYGNLYASVGAGRSSFGYAGEYQDPSGLLYLRARYYDPAQGRFFQMDPSRLGQNPYRYSYSNPLNYTDPSGLRANCGWWGPCPAGDTSSSTSPIIINLNITFPPEMMVLFATCNFEQDAYDYFSGVVDQLAIDMAYSPFVGAVTLISYIYIQPPPWESAFASKYPFRWIVNTSAVANIRYAIEVYDEKFWADTRGWYKAGRFTGRMIGIALSITTLYTGFETIVAGVSGGAASFILEGLSLGTSTGLSVTGVGISAGVVVVGVTEVVYGGAVLLAMAANPVGGRGGEGGGRELNFGDKIQKQLKDRGWTRESVEETVNHPHRTVETRDTRWRPDGRGRMDDPATAYINEDGSYVVVNDRTGDIVAISDRNDPHWLSPFD
jgi:RHS repeat-associated protein